MLAINAADDERNPPETGVTEAALKRIKNGKLYLIPASTETRGHLTTGNAKFYKQQLQELLATAPQHDDVKTLLSHRINFAGARSQAYYLSMHPLAWLGLNRVRLLKIRGAPQSRPPR